MSLDSLGAETGCRGVLRSLLAGRRFGFDVERAVYLDVLHRLMVSGSDRHAGEWRHESRVAGADELDLGQAYKAMASASGKTDSAPRGQAFCTFLAPVLRTQLMAQLSKRRGKSIEWLRIVDDLAVALAKPKPAPSGMKNVGEIYTP